MDFYSEIKKAIPEMNLASEGVEGDVSGFIDTGSYALNALISGTIYGGLPSNKITIFAGESSTGKTFYTLAICKHFLETNPQARIFYFDSEGAITVDLLKSRGIDTNRFYQISTTTVQHFKNNIHLLLDKYDKIEPKKRDPMMICLDSLGMLSTNKEMEDSLENKDSTDMTRSKLIKGLMRIVTGKLSKLGVPLIMTNHVYSLVGAYVPTKVSGGGTGPTYSASSIIQLSKSKDKDGTEVVGNIIKCKVEKSRFTRDNIAVETKLSFKTGLDRYSGLLDIAVEAGIWKDLKGKIELPDGSKTFAKRINANPKTYYTEEVLKQIDEYCGKKFKFGSEFGEETLETEIEDDSDE